MLTAAAIPLAAPAPAGAATIVAEYSPGIREADLGGELTVNGYGVSGLGAQRLALDDGSSALAMCIEADVSHSTTADYQPQSPRLDNGALDYLTWRYLGAGGGLGDVEAAGMAVAIWALTGAQRRGGGAVVTGDIVVDVAGVGRRDDVEAAARRFVGVATRRSGPWSMSEMALADTVASVVVSGPGGPIDGVEVTFAAGAWTATARTDDSGTASVELPVAELAGATVTAAAAGPGRSVEYGASGAQRFALAGPGAALSAAGVLPLPATTTVPETTTTVPETTTTVPETTTTLPETTTVPETTLPETVTVPATTTVPETTTIVTTTVPVTTTAPDTTTTVPTTVAMATAPPLAVTGRSGRGVARLGSALFAAGGIAVYLAAGSRRDRSRPERGPTGDG